MNELIEALQIFAKYVEPGSYASKYPFHCEHDVLYVPGVQFELVTLEDKLRLAELGFTESEYGGFESARYGSC